MSFYLFFLSGLLGGLFGGMGMGGGTLLIPLLTLFMGVPQVTAQGVNLLSFLPMSALALSVHAENGLLDVRGLPALVLPALFTSLGFALLSAYLPSSVLRRGFGFFLIALSVFQFYSNLKNSNFFTKKTF